MEKFLNKKTFIKFFNKNFFSKRIFNLFINKLMNKIINNKEEIKELTQKEKLCNDYHILTKRINNLQSIIDNVNDVNVVDALRDGISMYTKMRTVVFFQIKNL